MSKDKRNSSVEEMERIQRGLEAFLEQEVWSRQTDNGDAADSNRAVNKVKSAGRDKAVNRVKSVDRNQVVGREKSMDSDKAANRAKVADRNQVAGRGKSTGRNKAANKHKKADKNRVADWETIEEDKKILQGKKSKKKEKQEQPIPKKKKSKFKKVLATILVLTLLAGAGLYYLAGVCYEKMNYSEIQSLVTAPMKEEGVTNVLLIGNDSRTNGEDGRSDAMILVSISDKTKKIYMTSLLRDMYVEIPGHKSNRLNAAYSYGGAELLMETIEKNLDISVNRYVLVNFEAFAKLVDAVGGIELELTAKEKEYVNGYLVEYNILTNRPQGTDNIDASEDGLVHLNGPQALAYSRNRYIGTDFGRTQRQRNVLSAIIGKAPRALLTNPKELLDGLLPNLTTNLTKNEFIGLGFTAPKILTYEIVQGSLPIEGSYRGTTIRNMSVLEVDFEKNKEYLKEHIYGTE